MDERERIENHDKLLLELVLYGQETFNPMCDVMMEKKHRREVAKLRIKSLRKSDNREFKIAETAVDWHLSQTADLRRQLADWQDASKKVMSEKCPPDERHCTCVPYLRKEIDSLKQQLAAAQGDIAERDKIIRNRCHDIDDLIKRADAAERQLTEVEAHRVELAESIGELSRRECEMQDQIRFLQAEMNNKTKMVEWRECERIKAVGVISLMKIRILAALEMLKAFNLEVPETLNVAEQDLQDAIKIANGGSDDNTTSSMA